jgi:hypothetical protein
MKALPPTTAAAAILSLSGPARVASFTFTDISTSFADNAGLIEGPGFCGADAPWTTPIGGAAPFRARSCDPREGALGPKHPATVLVRYNLAGCRFPRGFWSRLSNKITGR